MLRVRVGKERKKKKGGKGTIKERSEGILERKDMPSKSLFPNDRSKSVPMMPSYPKRYSADILQLSCYLTWCLVDGRRM